MFIRIRKMTEKIDKVNFLHKYPNIAAYLILLTILS